MEKRRLEFDSMIAVCALLISCIAVVTAVYQTWVFRDQTRIIHDQYAATIWPYLNVEDTTDTNGSGSGATVSRITISLANNGLGPALIRDAQLYMDDGTVSKWNDLRDLFQRTEKRARGIVRHVQMGSVDASTTIRPGDSRQVFDIALSPAVSMQQFLNHNVRMELCYCSLNGQCWTLHHNIAQSNRSFPVPVNHCGATHSIQSSSV